VLRRFDSSASSLYLSLVMSELRSRIRVPAKKPRSWAVTLIRNRDVFFGFVEAPDQKGGRGSDPFRCANLTVEVGRAPAGRLIPVGSRMRCTALTVATRI
jgi:hypothetical protein